MTNFTIVYLKNSWNESAQGFTRICNHLNELGAVVTKANCEGDIEYVKSGIEFRLLALTVEGAKTKLIGLKNLLLDSESMPIPAEANKQIGICVRSELGVMFKFSNVEIKFFRKTSNG